MAYFDNSYRDDAPRQRAFTEEAPLGKRIAVGAGVFSAIVGGAAALFAFSVTGGLDLVPGAEAHGPRNTMALDGHQPREIDWAEIEETLSAPAARPRIQQAAFDAADETLTGAPADPGFAQASWEQPAEAPLPAFDEDNALEDELFAEEPEIGADF
ncbi:MAG: hypothetical protein AB7J28_04470 [Hyphomonadaceae bacterium]